MFSIGEHNVSGDEMEALRDVCNEETKLGDATIGRRLVGGGATGAFTLVANGQTVDVALQPVDSTVTIDTSQAQTVPSYAVVVDTERGWSWRLPADIVDGLSCLPSLETAHHEADREHEREANYRYRFNDGSTLVAAAADNPVDRLDASVRFERMRFLGGMFPRKWLFETADGAVWYLHERSGSIRLYDGPSRLSDTCVFHAFIGRDHPGTHLKDEEVLNIVTSVDYISIVDNPEDVSDAALDAYHNPSDHDVDPADFIGGLEE